MDVQTSMADVPDVPQYAQELDAQLLEERRRRAAQSGMAMSAPPAMPSNIPDMPIRPPSPPPDPNTRSPQMSALADRATIAPPDEPDEATRDAATVVEAPAQIKSTIEAPPDDPNALGRSPLYRRGQMAQMQSQDEQPRQVAQPEDPRVTASKQNMAALAMKSKEHVPAWRQAVGAALSFAPRTRGIGQMVMNPPDKAEELSGALLKGAAQADAEKVAAERAEYNKENIHTLAAQRESYAETRRLQADARLQQAATAQQKVEEIKDANIRKWVDDRIGTSRQADKIYQKESDPRPPNYEFISNPKEPGMGWAVPPAWLPMPKELAPLAPGYPAGEHAPHSVVQRAMELYGKQQLENTKGENRNVPLENQIVNEHIANTHPGESLALARQHTQPPPKPRQPPQALMFQPDGKGGQVAVAVGPGTSIPAGTMTSAGVNTANTQTAQNRTRSEFAQTVVDQVPKLYGRIDALGEKIGPGAGRWNQMWVNKAGMDDPDFARLDQDLKMYASAVVVAHFGARGGGKDYREALEKNFGEAQSPANLKARIESADEWLSGYAKMGQPKPTQPAAPTYKPNDTRNINGVNYVRDAKGTWHPK